MATWLFSGANGVFFIPVEVFVDIFIARDLFKDVGYIEPLSLTYINVSRTVVAVKGILKLLASYELAGWLVCC